MDRAEVLNLLTGWKTMKGGIGGYQRRSGCFELFKDPLLIGEKLLHAHFVHYRELFLQLRFARSTSEHVHNADDNARGDEENQDDDEPNWRIS